MIWRGPWDGKWDGTWEGQDQPLAPGFIRGAATIRVNATAAIEAIGHAAGAATVAIGASGQLTVPLPEGFISGTATITIGATGRLIDPDAIVPEIPRGGGGGRRRPMYRGPKKKLVEEVRRTVPVEVPPPIVLPELDIAAIIREQVALHIRRSVNQPTLQKPRIVNRTVNRPPDQRIAPAGIAAEWWGIPAVVEDLTPIIEARKARDRRRLLLLAAAHYYEEAA